MWDSKWSVLAILRLLYMVFDSSLEQVHEHLGTDSVFNDQRYLGLPGLVNIQKTIENGHRNSGFTH